MKNQFNADCANCGKFRPRCAAVFLRVQGKATQYHAEPVSLCEGCRKSMHGKYRLDNKHH
jgi:hypothetical protein